MVNHKIVKSETASLSDIIEVAQAIADTPQIDPATAYLLFSGGTIRGINGKTNELIHGKAYRACGGDLCQSNTILPVSKVLSFSCFVDQFAPTNMRASYVVYDGGAQAVRVMFNFNGVCDYIWKLQPISEMNSSYVY